MFDVDVSTEMNTDDEGGIPTRATDYLLWSFLVVLLPFHLIGTTVVFRSLHSVVDQVPYYLLEGLK